MDQEETPTDGCALNVKIPAFLLTYPSGRVLILSTTPNQCALESDYHCIQEEASGIVLCQVYWCIIWGPVPPCGHRCIHLHLQHVH